jgi:hypothetical protein
VGKWVGKWVFLGSSKVIKISKNAAKTHLFILLSSIFYIASPEFDIEWKNEDLL